MTMHPVLHAAFEALDRDEVRWCLLRVPVNPEAPTGDVDLLVDTGDLHRLRPLLAQVGFVPVPGWETPPSLLFLTYDDRSGQCLLLEVTDEVSFGSGLVLRTGLADQVLSGSRPHGFLRVPSADDSFWALILHCLLDSGTGRVPERYQQRLQVLAAEAADSGSFGRLVDAHAPTGWSSGRVRTAALSGRWEDLDELGKLLSQSWLDSVPWPARQRAAVTRARRLWRAPRLLRQRLGVSVALLGPNGAGKSTLAAGIEQAWPLPVKRVYMGLWKSGSVPGQEIPGLAQLLRLPTAWLRYLRGLVAQLRGNLVVFDRYVHDARLPPRRPFVALKRLYLWLLAHGVPNPDLILLLSVTGAVSHHRKPEDTLAAAEREHDEYLTLAAALPGVRVIDATADIDTVRAVALEAIWNRTQQRWRTTARVPVGRRRTTEEPA